MTQLKAHSNVYSAIAADTHAAIDGVASYMHQHMQAFLWQLRALCDIASPSNNPAGLKQAAAWLAQRLAQAGMEVTVVAHERGDAVIGKLEGNNPQAQPILLLGHHDTIYFEEVAAPPSIIEGDKFFGPGVSDMKGGLLQSIFAIEALRQHGFNDFSTILFLSVPDEEIDHRYHGAELERLCHTYHPFVLVLENSQTIGNVVVRRKGVQRYEFMARGIPAHAGADFHNGRSAVLELAYQLVRFCTLPALPEGATVNIGPFTGGTLPNIVADYAKATIEMRFLSRTDEQLVLRRWKQLLDDPLVPDVVITMEALQGGIEPMRLTGRSQEVVEHIAMLAHDRGWEFHAETRGGSSDGGSASAMGFDALDGFGAVGHQGHSPEEFLSISSVPHKTALLAAAIMLASHKDPDDSN